MQDLTLNFHSDPGHGWLEVPASMLDQFGIADKVSRYSYQGRGCVYLEEDCDYSLLIQALKSAGVSYQIRQLPQVNSDSFIRNLDRYQGA